MVNAVGRRGWGPGVSLRDEWLGAGRMAQGHRPEAGPQGSADSEVGCLIFEQYGTWAGAGLVSEASGPEPVFTWRNPVKTGAMRGAPRPPHTGPVFEIGAGV